MASAKDSLRAGKRDGIEAAALLRDIMDIPVVFLTADGDQEPPELAADRRRGRQRADGVGLWSEEDEGLKEK
jgi:CheY-like chemotaxis protein